MSENANARWLADRVAYLRQLKAPSEPQRLLMMLAEKPDRSPADDRHLAVLVRAEKADERFAKLRGLAAKVVSEEKAAWPRKWCPRRRPPPARPVTIV